MSAFGHRRETDIARLKAAEVALPALMLRLDAHGVSHDLARHYGEVVWALGECSRGAGDAKEMAIILEKLRDCHRELESRIGFYSMLHQTPISFDKNRICDRDEVTS